MILEKRWVALNAQVDGFERIGNELRGFIDKLIGDSSFLIALRFVWSLGITTSVVLRFRIFFKDLRYGDYETIDALLH
jgi:hypothetical protein